MYTCHKDCPKNVNNNAAVITTTTTMNNIELFTFGRLLVVAVTAGVDAVVIVVVVGHKTFEYEKIKV